MSRKYMSRDQGSLSSVGMFKDVFVSKAKRMADRSKKYREAMRLSSKAKGFLDRVVDMGCVLVAENNTLFVYAPDTEGIVVLKDGRKARCLATMDFKTSDIPF